MKLKILMCCVLVCSAVFAGKTIVTVDENGEIAPQAAATAIRSAASAAVQVDLAETKAIVLTNVAAIASSTIDMANRLLNERTDYSIVSLHAVGMERIGGDGTASGNASGSAGDAGAGAAADGSTDANAKIQIVAVNVDRSSDPDNIRVTLTWQYVQGAFNQPKILAAAALDQDFAAVNMSEPEQIKWSDTVAFQATAVLPVETYGRTSFFKVTANIDTPVDDGKVFDIYSDGTDFELTFKPSASYKVRIVSGRIVSIEKEQ